MRTLLAALLALCAIFAFGELRYRGAPVVAASAAANVFSAERARASLSNVLGDDGSHATGTASLARVRGRLVETLRALGYAPEERATLACGRYGTCARVNRVLARFPGTASTGAVLLIAHLDAVGASPGASDDGAGVASGLEIARVLRTLPPLRNDVLLLFVEGEELGLLGAEAFVRDDPAAREVSVVINLEARGSRDGASLFQLSRGGGFLIDTAARSGERPVGSSLFSTIYERMPNDTDLTVFLERGYLGMNYAFTGSIEHYHTSRDDLAHQDPRSVQHLGERALSSIRALGDVDLRSVPRYDLVWFDVLGLAIVRYRASLALPLAVAALSSLLVAALVAARAKRVSFREIALGLAAWVGAFVVAGILAIGVLVAVRAAGRVPTPWIAHPAAVLAALIAIAFVAVILVAGLLNRRLAPAAPLNAVSFAFAIWILHALLGVALAATLPGASYLFVVPSLVAGGVALLACVPALRVHRDVAIAVPALVSAIVWLVVVRGLYPALGLMAAPGVSLTLVIVLMPFAPLLEGPPQRIVSRAAVTFLVFAGAATVIACLAPPFSREVPRRVNALYVRDESGARVGVDASWGGTPWGSVPEEMRRALGPAARDGVPLPWRDDTIALADAPVIELPAPTVEPVAEGSGPRRVVMRIRSRRGAPTLFLIAPAGANLAHVEVRGATSAATFFRRTLAAGARGVRFDGIGEEGVEVVCSFAGAPGELFVADASYGIPPEVRAIADARPVDAVASQDGDLTIAYRRFQP